MITPTFTAPRLVVSGLSGGGGKTLVSLGLARALTLRGLRVKPCKKGPDYIDAAWLSLASGRTPTNLDPYFLSDDRLRALFRASFDDADLAIIEGNRGLYDGRDLEGSCSTATLARALDAPVLLTLTVTKMTRTAAAVVAGLANFEPVKLAGVILNRVASSRHADLIRRSIETYTGIPVLGEIPRLAENPIPERHMGLVSMHDESPDAPGRSELLAALPRWWKTTSTLKPSSASPGPLPNWPVRMRFGKRPLPVPSAPHPFPKRSRAPNGARSPTP